MWVRSNRGFLERDLRMLLDEQCQVRVGKIECRMLGVTRNAVAVFEVKEEQIDAIIERLALREALEGTEEEALLGDILNSEEHKDIDELRAFSGSGGKWYCSERRAKTLVLGNGISFEYFIFLVAPQTRKVCVLLSYAYG